MIDAVLLINDNVLMHCVLLFEGENKDCIQNVRKTVHESKILLIMKVQILD